jgi:hypothetical protein
MINPDLNAVRYVASRIPRAPVQLPQSPVRVRIRPGKANTDATVLAPKKKPLAEGVQLDHKAGRPSKMSDRRPPGWKPKTFNGAKRVKSSAPAPEPGFSRGLKPQPGGGGPNPVDLNDFDRQTGDPRGVRPDKKVAGSPLPVVDPDERWPDMPSWGPDEKGHDISGKGIPMGGEDFPVRRPEVAGEKYDQKVWDRAADHKAKVSRARPGRAVQDAMGVYHGAVHVDPEGLHRDVTYGTSQLNPHAPMYPDFDTSNIVHVPRAAGGRGRSARDIQTQMPSRTFAMPGQAPAAIAGRPAMRALGAGPAQSSGRTYAMPQAKAPGAIGSPTASFAAPPAAQGPAGGGVRFLGSVPPAATTPHPGGNAGLVNQARRNISAMQFPNFRSMP